jgi:xyloglucan fucosyltransferase
LAGSSLLLLLLLPQLLAGAQRFELAQLGQAHPRVDVSRSHRNAVHKIRMLQRLRAAEWEMRRDAVEDLLQGYRARHLACQNSSGLPGPYFLLHTMDNVSGIGNQLPSVISGVPQQRFLGFWHGSPCMRAWGLQRGLTLCMLQGSCWRS